MPCHIYWTLTDQSPSESLIVNFHSLDRPNPILYYDTVSHAGQPASAYSFSKTGHTFYMGGIDEPRWVSWVEMTGLSPATVYYFRVGDADNANRLSEEKKVRSGAGGTTFRFVAGGDMDINSEAVKVLWNERDDWVKEERLGDGGGGHGCEQPFLFGVSLSLCVYCPCVRLSDAPSLGAPPCVRR